MAKAKNKALPALPDKSDLPREARRVADTTFDRIWKHYYSDKRIELSEKENVIRARWEHVWKLLGDILMTTKIVNLHCSEFNIDEQTAYRDLRNAKLLFGDAQDQMKKAKREIASMWAQQALKKAYDNNNWKSFEKILLRFSRINGLDVNENDQLSEMIKKMKPHMIIITGDPKALKEEADQLMADVDTKDVDYEVAGEEE